MECHDGLVKNCMRRVEGKPVAEIVVMTIINYKTEALTKYDQLNKTLGK